MKPRPATLLALALWAALPVTVEAESPLQADGFETLSWKDQLAQIMADPDWIGAPVESVFWSLDGQSLHYALKREGSSLRDLWRVAAAGGAPRKLGDDELAQLDAADPVYSADAQRIAFVREGDVFVRSTAGALRQLTRTAEAESEPQFAPDGAALLWRSGNQWYRHEFATDLTGALAELKAEKDPAKPDPDALRDHQLRLSDTLARIKADREAVQARERERRALDPSLPPLPIHLGEGISISNAVASPDARWMLVVTEPKAADAGRAGKMPKYVTESGYEEVEDVRTRVGRNPPSGQALLLVDLQAQTVSAVELKSLPGIETDPLAELRKQAGKPALEGQRPLRIDAIEWNARGDRAALMLRAVDNKDRWIATLDPAAKPVLHSRHRLSDPAWINWAFNEFGWLPDGRHLWYLSEESGWSHLYLREDRDRARPQALSEGRWEASAVRWTRDGSRAYFLCNRAWPGDYEVCTVPRQGGTVSEVTALDGVEDFVLSPDERQLALRVSAHHTPPQLAVQALDGSAARRLTDTRSEHYRSRRWLAPEFVQVPSSHGAGTIWGKFYRPATLAPGKRYPIVLFVHGAGYLQNVSARWPNYFREQMFHQLLVDAGYLVLDLDYRASEGYGRDWRGAIYRRMGHPELEDYLDGIEWLVAQQQGDRSRVGIYGGSYGGFMAFMAMFRAPDAFHAGAALRPVSDWTSYNHEYTSNILNTPELDPEAYRVSSPIEYADNLRGPLLIAHGMIDDNVFYQDSVRLAQRLIELRKDGWELASYPLERHGYVHPESWYDQYRRIFELFERTLRPH